MSTTFDVRRWATQAAPNERAAFEAWLRVKPCGAAHDFAWEAWRARAALAAPQPPEAAQSNSIEFCGIKTDAAPVQMPEPDAWRYTTVRGHFRYRGRRVGFAAEYPMLKPDPLYTEQQVRALLAAQAKQGEQP